MGCDTCGNGYGLVWVRVWVELETPGSLGRVMDLDEVVYLQAWYKPILNIHLGLFKCDDIATLPRCKCGEEMERAAPLGLRSHSRTLDYSAKVETGGRKLIKIFQITRGYGI
ncbi:hypothetical protein BDQ17DRAFT_1334037 [Cyathus striatus]|nr:hypothetical protein BDQ17DRAFT_1334037 [Cyathus striatus]